jgi:beta-phosphoglucomutase-like phosphatase (HAD superfamily)
MKYTSYLWDFDGTLFDTYPHIAEAFEQIMTREGIEFDHDNVLRCLYISFGEAKKYYRLSEEMTDRLTAFAKTADPNADDLIKWESGGKAALTLGDGETALSNPSKFKLWVTMFTNKAPGE